MKKPTNLFTGCLPGLLLGATQLADQLQVELYDSDLSPAGAIFR